MKKLLLACLLLVSLVATGCFGGASSNIIKDEGALAKIVEALKNAEGLKGKEILVFQSVTIMTGETGNRIAIDILKPGTDDEVDRYEYSNGWSKPNPVQLRGAGKAIDNCIPLEKLNMAKIPDMYKIVEEKIKDIEGAKVGNIVVYRFWRGNWDIAFNAESPRAKYLAEFDLDGKLKKFSKS